MLGLMSDKKMKGEGSSNDNDAGERTPLQGTANRFYQSFSPLEMEGTSSHGLMSALVRTIDKDTLEEGDVQHEVLKAQDSLEKSSVSQDKRSRYVLSTIGLVFSSVLLLLAVIRVFTPVMRASWSANAAPFSIVEPATVGFKSVDRPVLSSPGPIFDHASGPLPTNSWCENFFLGASNTGEQNKVFQIPYILDTGGYIRGVRVHPAHVQANDRSIMMTYELENGLTLGGAENWLTQHHVKADDGEAIARLSVVLEWDTTVGEEASQLGATAATEKSKGLNPRMLAPVVRGAPYISMEYEHATPQIFGQRMLSAKPLADGVSVMTCGSKPGEWGPAVAVHNEIQLQFDTSDMTWLVFPSEPAEFSCINIPAPLNPGPPPAPGVVQEAVVTDGALFYLRATKPMRRGMVRVAMANNCTTGQNPQYCDDFQPRDNSAFASLLRSHKDLYPTGGADIEFTFPVDAGKDEELRLIFDWKAASMRDIGKSTSGSDAPVQSLKKNNNPTFVPGRVDQPTYPSSATELLMYATPHHQERVRATADSTNQVLDVGCNPTIHGHTCPVLGNTWSMVEHIHDVGFKAEHPVRAEMLPDLRKALKKDIQYALPPNYMKGAGDTYFSGKMLAKLARILVIADETEGAVTDKEFSSALARLRAGTEVWLNGSAESPLLYDHKWGGVVMCGCDYNEESGHCNNAFPDCPALSDAGQNFGAGFYNDHHYHFGYHIYAASVVARFDPSWGRRFFEHVMMLIRDIANPSTQDPYFPTFRHKDWYLGFSWASGIVTIQGQPYPNGRNQESSSEAISAYEAVALFGDTMAKIFNDSGDDSDLVPLDASQRVREMGRLLMATEIRSAKTYWHVQDRHTPGVARVYPDVYAPKVIGMMWSMLAQEQTWFGNEPWKSYGIQLMPLTVASEQRDSPSWVRDMLPVFQKSCDGSEDCQAQGWSVLVYAMQATLGQWKQARAGVLQLDAAVFEGAGGNGHSLSNSLWYIATRPTPSEADFAKGNMYDNVEF